MSDVGRNHSREFKLAALARMESGENVCALARELGVKRKLLYDWRDRFRRYGEAALRGRGRPKGETAPQQECLAKSEIRAPALAQADDELAAAKRRIAELERKLGQQELDLDFFRLALQRVGAKRPTSGASGGATFTKSSKP
jgi:transposase-like protein